MNTRAKFVMDYNITHILHLFMRERGVIKLRSVFVMMKVLSVRNSWNFVKSLEVLILSILN